MLLNLVFLQPLSALAETSTKPPPENVKETACPPSYVGQKKCFVIDNPKKPKTTTIIVQKMPVVKPPTNPTGIPGGVSVSLSVLKSLALATPAGQELYNQTTSQINSVDLMLGEAMGTAIQDTKDSSALIAENGNVIWSFSRTVYDDLDRIFQDAWRKWFPVPGKVDSWFGQIVSGYPTGFSIDGSKLVVPYAYETLPYSFQHKDINNNIIYYSFFVIHKRDINQYWGTYATLHLKYSDSDNNEIPDTGSLRLHYGPGQVYSQPNYVPYLDAVAWAKDKYTFEKGVNKGVPIEVQVDSPINLGSYYSPSASGDTRLRIPPMLPGLDGKQEVPQIIQDTETGTQYWEVPSTDPNGEEMPLLIPTTPDGENIPGRTIITEDGEEVKEDGTTGDIIVTPIEMPVPVPTEEEEAKPMWASLMLKLSAIGTAVTGIYDKIKTCKQCTQIPDVWNPWVLFAPYLAFMLAAISFLGAVAVLIVSIPLIPKKPFPEPYNEVVEWFRAYSLGGIVIYDVMISLTFLLLAFFIYKLIRRSL